MATRTFVLHHNCTIICLAHFCCIPALKKHINCSITFLEATFFRKKMLKHLRHVKNYFSHQILLQHVQISVDFIPTQLQGVCRLFPHRKNKRKRTCPLKRTYFNRKYIFQPLMFRGHVRFPGKQHETTVTMEKFQPFVQMYLPTKTCIFLSACHRSFFWGVILGGSSQLVSG